jgi:hypothetical protein
MEKRDELLRFYFGSIEDSTRLRVERDLLMDSELLVNYFDLKRKLEAAADVPTMPSWSVWQRLQRHVKERPAPNRILAFGLGVAASVIFLVVTLASFFPVSEIERRAPQILIDVNSELPVSSNVL